MIQEEMEAREFAKKFLEKHPEHRVIVNGFFQLMMDEIENDESAQNELELFISACEDLVIE